MSNRQTVSEKDTTAADAALISAIELRDKIFELEDSESTLLIDLLCFRLANVARQHRKPAETQQFMRRAA